MHPNLWPQWRSASSAVDNSGPPLALASSRILPFPGASSNLDYP